MFDVLDDGDGGEGGRHGVVVLKRKGVMVRTVVVVIDKMVVVG